MTTKTYRANTNVSINVVFANKKNLHISFVPQSDGSSVFVTSDEDVQKAIERHYKFGRLFRLASVRNVPTNQKQEPTQDDGNDVDKEPPVQTIVENTGDTDDENIGNVPEGDEQNVDATDNGTAEQPELRIVQVSDISAAKDYLAENFGLTRSSMRSQKAILDTAAAYGVRFEILS